MNGIYFIPKMINEIYWSKSNPMTIPVRGFRIISTEEKSSDNLSFFLKGNGYYIDNFRRTDTPFTGAPSEKEALEEYNIIRGVNTPEDALMRFFPDDPEVEFEVIKSY